MYKLDSENPEESDIKLVISIGSQAKQENSRKTSTCLTMQKPLPVCITGNCKIIKEIGIPDHLTPFWEIGIQVKKQQLEVDKEQQTGSKLGYGYIRLHIVTLII